MFFVIVI